MKAKDFEQQLDEAADITASLDREASRLGVTRQSIIKIWLAERLEKSALNHPSNGTR